MKKICLYTSLFALSCIFFTSCKKEHVDNEQRNYALDVTLAAGTAYSLDLSKYGDADDLAKISTQAIDYTTSEISEASAPGIYTFLKAGTPKAGGNGSETVVLEVYEPAGRGHCDHPTDITIHFTIL